MITHRHISAIFMVQASSYGRFAQRTRADTRHKEFAMNFSQFKTKELVLLLMGLRTIYVADEAELQEEMIRQLEAKLSMRMVSLKK